MSKKAKGFPKISGTHKENKLVIAIFKSISIILMISKNSFQITEIS